MGTKRSGGYIVIDVNDDMSPKNPRVDMTTGQLPQVPSFIR